MRHIGFALGLSLFCSTAGAFELEVSRSYPAQAAQSTLRILSTADVEVFEPILLAFQDLHPTISVQYDVASSAEVMRGLYAEGAVYDLAISSAMDLQTKLANDGFAQSYRSNATASLPDWATWRDQVFAFTQEPTVLVISQAALEGLPVPTNRAGLIELLRAHPDVFDGRIGTYDVRVSGAGYLFATQDSRNTESFWRLTEVMGRLNARLYCCSGQMISDVSDGTLAIAYNVLGSYAQSRLEDTPGIKIVEMDDFVSVMLRTALIPVTAKSVQESGLMIDFLADLRNRPQLVAQTGLPPVEALQADEAPERRPIRLGPGLLVFLDTMRRQTFLRSWVSSMEQR
ncbi:substrate-binding domain-containing protein [Litoreibacter sp.]|nr:substrate-binding domain-containing protein [Litoreibacter sp.]